MKVSILGNGLTSLALAKAMTNLGINVDIFSNQKLRKYEKIQSLGISKLNINFFNKNIMNIEKFLWNINKIEIYSDNLKNEKILNFENNNEYLFSMIRNIDLYNFLFLSLKKNKLVSFKKEINYKLLSKRDYKLIFNCDKKNYITKKFFYKKIEKKYDSFAHITSFKHKELPNNTAVQIFTKKGPVAFLPISSTETSVVFSIRGKKIVDLENLIRKYNSKYEILKINKIYHFELKSSNLRSYYHNNIIAFGDILHRLHPHAGQGFNMSIRDIKEILKLISFRQMHGLDLDNSICLDFEKNTKNKNYLFSSGIDFIYEFFNMESKTKTKVFSKSIQLAGKNKIINNFFTKLADTGIVV